MTERNGDRPDTPDTRPAPVITSKARTATWVRTGNNSMVTGRTGSRAGDGDVQPYERTTDAPAPTLDTNVGSKWSVGFGNQEHSAVRSVDEPAATLRYSERANACDWVAERPATTVQGDPHIAEPRHRDREGGVSQFAGESVRVSVEEAACLQTFPPGYPWQGSRTAQFRQIGDAVPPLLSVAVLGHLLGIDEWRSICQNAYRSSDDEAVA